ncbi:related to transcription activator protein acu-15 [Cephalotrichum gorgonifer]|uniref:Related to transcription activator protein acu-15 n=1 Tax=Cephalotrichum gorgonifer TaxID=2041049 RepID=A0AAE8MQ71_9PEZI|nr:related to transcription activator protein acu-15 [Cephalotrichum gorgonifer]
MPGILPMKVIKVGTSSQSRIAQACDRCRSKKIRCDGIRPTCSQCSNVGFECKTSDKLSRRAFPRGYTESLEERVRQLETEVRELKDLLDEKDEKIDMLSRLYGNRPSPPAHSPVSERKSTATTQAKEDTFRVQASPLLLGVENSDSYFMGASSGRSFIESVKRKIQESGKSCEGFNPESFLHIQGCHPLSANVPDSTSRIPPRLFTDRCVNVYFQEWAALFPVLHKPTFLRIYEEFVADPEKIKDNHKIAQIYLVFSIAALAGDFPDPEQIAVCEREWQKALDAVLMDNTIITLQCLILALMYCTVRADYKRLQHYKGIAVGLSHRLGLHQSQKRFSFGALTIETRKKVFWTLYTIDCFSAAILGLPKLLKEDDIHAEYPADMDDEYVTEKGFQPTLPGECTRLSNALALFRGTRILAKVLEGVYPAASTHELSLQRLSALDDELTQWYNNLPDNLRLTFAQDKPSTDITGSRSPLMALAYYYIRILIQRPAVGSTLGQKATPALISIGDSSKHIIQIIELLEERNMTFSFCLNKTDVLVICGMTQLYQTLALKHDSKLSKDGQKLVNGVIRMLLKAKAVGSLEFKRVSGMVVKVDEARPPTPPQSTPGASTSSAGSSSSQQGSPPTGRLETPPAHRGQSMGRLSAASASESDLLQQQAKLRRMTMPSTAHPRAEVAPPQGRRSFDTNSPAQPTRRQHGASQQMSPQTHGLDYLSLSGGVATQHAARMQLHGRQYNNNNGLAGSQAQRLAQMYQTCPEESKAAEFSPAQWEALLGTLDGGQANVYDAIYGGPSPISMHEQQALDNTTHTVGAGWLDEPWNLAGFAMGDLDGAGQSVLSMSDESLSPGEEMTPTDLGLGVDGLDLGDGISRRYGSWNTRQRGGAAQGADDQARTPQCIAHRGYKAKFPENTMAAFRAAVALGAQAIETDLHLSRDGVVVLSHDGTLKRCFGVDREIRSCDWSYIRTLRTLREPHAPMPTLSELLDFLARDGLGDVWLLLDVKMDDDAEELIARTADTIASSPSGARPWNERITIGCWNESYLALARSYLPTHPLSYINISVHHAKPLIGTPGISFNLLHLVLASPQGACFRRAARAAGDPVYGWTMNRESWMEWAICAGLDGVVTDEVELFLDVAKRWRNRKALGLRERGRAVPPGGMWASLWLAGVSLIAAIAAALMPAWGAYKGVTRRPRGKS